MSRQYWLDLFSGKTWEEFLKNGATISGFRERRRKIAGKIEPGDYLICYVTGISRFIAILEVKSRTFIDNSKIWEDDAFPVRFKVSLLYKLEPETAIPVLSLKDKLTLFKNLKYPKAWGAFFRGSPIKFNPVDGEIITNSIVEATRNPVKRPFDEEKYRRPAYLYKSKIGVVTIPEKEETESITEDDIRSTHEEIQWLLLNLGSNMKLDVWVARNDRNKTYNGKAFQDVPNLKKELPRQFDPVTNRIIELIDVLWFQGNSIIAAFEVEHTSSIYSGLLRMSDLLSTQPNIKINLFLVAHDDKREKVKNEINRPTFARLDPPLPKICRFIPYSKLKKEIEGLGPKIKYLRPEFLDEISESCEIEEI